MEGRSDQFEVPVAEPRLATKIYRCLIAGLPCSLHDAASFAISLDPKAGEIAGMAPATAPMAAPSVPAMIAIAAWLTGQSTKSHWFRI